MEIVEIEWLDSQGYAQWQDKKEMSAWAEEEKMICHSVGYLLKEYKDRVVIVQSESSGCYGEGLIIPCVAIVKMSRLSRPKKARR